MRHQELALLPNGGIAQPSAGLWKGWEANCDMETKSNFRIQKVDFPRNVVSKQ